MIRALLAALLVLAPPVFGADYPTTIAGFTPCHQYHMDATSGSTETDDTSVAGGGCVSGTNGSYTSVTLNQAGILGTPTSRAVLFDSTNGQMSVAHNTDLLPNNTDTAGWTFVAWVYPTSTAVDHYVYGSFVTGKDAHFFALNNGGTFRQVVYQSNCLTVSATSGNLSSYTANAWQMFAGVTVGSGGATFSSMKTYRNDTLANTQTTFAGTFCTDNTTNHLFSRTALGDAINGYGDELALFNTALNDTNIADLYNAGITQAEIPPKGRRLFQAARVWLPRSWWPLLVGLEPPAPFAIPAPVFEVARLNRLAERSPGLYR